MRTSFRKEICVCLKVEKVCSCVFPPPLVDTNFENGGFQHLFLDLSLIELIELMLHFAEKGKAKTLS